MTSKTLVILDHIITLINKNKMEPDYRDDYDQIGHYNSGIDSSITEIEIFKKFLIDIGVEA